MDFIDLFDFSKYFKRDGDGKRAKIGHVNAVIEEFGFTETIIEVSSAEILAMGTSPIELLPAPGANKYYEFDKIIVENLFNTTAYSLADGVVYIAGINGNSVEFDIHPSIITSNTSSVAILKQYNSFSVIEEGGQIGVDYLNGGLIMTTWNASNPTLGDGTLRILIYSKIRTIGE